MLLTSFVLREMRPSCSKRFRGRLFTSLAEFIKSGTVQNGSFTSTFELDGTRISYFPEPKLAYHT